MSDRSSEATTTRLLYYDDVEGEYLRTFAGRVVASGPDWVALDQTAFHVEGGGQAADHGLLHLAGPDGSSQGSAVRVVDVQQDPADGLVKHHLAPLDPSAGPLAVPSPGSEVRGELDWVRRFLLMRGHTSGHLLAKAAWGLLNARTVSNSIEHDKLRIDVDARLTQDDLKRLEDEVNQAIARDRAVTVRMMARAALEDGEPGARGLLALSPPGDTLRAIEVNGYDLCPCSGTHVKGTREVGGVVLSGRKSKGKGVDRITYRLAADPEA